MVPCTMYEAQFESELYRINLSCSSIIPEDAFSSGIKTIGKVYANFITNGEHLFYLTALYQEHLVTFLMNVMSL